VSERLRVPTDSTSMATTRPELGPLFQKTGTTPIPQNPKGTDGGA
jgi:hypothetical protein